MPSPQLAVSLSLIALPSTAPPLLTHPRCHYPFIPAAVWQAQQCRQGGCPAEAGALDP